MIEGAQLGCMDFELTRIPSQNRLAHREFCTLWSCSVCMSYVLWPRRLIANSMFLV